MSKALEKALYKAAALTFEELGFMLPSPEIEEEQRAADAEIAVIVRFRGPVQGKLIVLLCGALLPTLAANMLGVESIPSLEQQHDALREVGNVICGNMLPLIAGTKPVFNVDLPQIVSDLNQLPSPPPLASARIGIEEGRAELMLYVDDPQALEELIV
jgi:CheY-specific phosphatase CheX